MTVRRAVLSLIAATLSMGPSLRSEAQIGVPETAIPEEITVEGNVTFGPGTFILADPAIGLPRLASYRATLSLSFVGTEDGRPSRWSQTYVMLSTAEPMARQLRIETTGQPAGPGPVLVGAQAGVAYERRGEEACTTTAISAVDWIPAAVEPATLLLGVIGAEEGGARTVNGVSANRYTFDESALGEAGFVEADGEIWVATEGGHVVRYAMTATGAADYFGAGIAGTVTWLYDLTDINQPLTIALPADCATGLIDAPLLADAADIVSAPGLLGYTTLAPLAEVVAFYQERLPVSGWRPGPNPFVDETRALLDFTRADQELILVIAPGERGTTVQLAALPK